MSSYLAVSPLPTTVETVAGGLLSVALFPDLAIGGRYPPSYPAESGLSSKERLATLSPRPSVRLLFFSFSKRNAEKAPTSDASALSSIIPSNAFFSTPRARFFPFSRRFYRNRVRRRKTNKIRRQGNLRDKSRIAVIVKIEKEKQPKRAEKNGQESDINAKTERARWNAFDFLSSFRKPSDPLSSPAESPVKSARPF